MNRNHRRWHLIISHIDHENSRSLLSVSTPITNAHLLLSHAWERRTLELLICYSIIFPNSCFKNYILSIWKCARHKIFLFKYSVQTVTCCVRINICSSRWRWGWISLQIGVNFSFTTLIDNGEMKSWNLIMVSKTNEQQKIISERNYIVTSSIQ